MPITSLLNIPQIKGFRQLLTCLTFFQKRRKKQAFGAPSVGVVSYLDDNAGVLIKNEYNYKT